MAEQDATHSNVSVRTYSAEASKPSIQPRELKRDISERFAMLAQREDNWDGYDSKNRLR